MEEMTVRQFCEHYLNGDFQDDKAKDAFQGGYFCREDQLPERLVRIWEVLEGIYREGNSFILDRYSIRVTDKFSYECHPCYDEVKFSPIISPVMVDRTVFHVVVGNRNRDYMYEIGFDGKPAAGFNDVKFVHMFLNNAV